VGGWVPKRVKRRSDGCARVSKAQGEGVRAAKRKRSRKLSLSLLSDEECAGWGSTEPMWQKYFRGGGGGG
jgi:hypothetical protein